MNYVLDTNILIFYLKIFLSARNMQKNDLWIAATSSIINANLISSDNDFSHLNNIYLDFSYVDIEKIRGKDTKFNYTIFIRILL